jgi:quinol-cytochrome oxidoreductase complex cytochrome b subunit
MLEWLRRQRQRQIDLDRGVDADLVQANRRRWKLTAVLFVLAFISMGVLAAGRFSGLLNQVCIVITLVLFFSAMILGNVARAWDGFLGKPDAKEPPRLWKWRR